MPRHPATSTRIGAMPKGVFSTVAHRIAALTGEVYPLHIGDTWLEPAPGCRLQDLADAPLGLHRYCKPRGLPELLDTAAALRDVPVERVIVTAGATGAMASALGAILRADDEVMLLAPYWPLIRGIVHTRGGVPVDVPFYVPPPGRSLPESVDACLAPYLTDRTVALYLNSPNNPTGRVLDGDVMAALADFARRHDLWILSDEVYDPFAWARPHHPIRLLAPERTFSAFSFSKAYGMAGNRVGYLVGPTVPGVMAEVRKVHMHAYYSAPVGPQLGAARVLREGGSWLTQAGQAYREAGDAAAAVLGLPPPEGGTFLFVDVSEQLDERGMQGFLEDCIDHRLLVAPGGSCGHDYQGCVRVCFTSAPPDVVARGIAVLADLLAR